MLIGSNHSELDLKVFNNKFEKMSKRKFQRMKYVKISREAQKTVAMRLQDKIIQRGKKT